MAQPGAWKVVGRVGSPAKERHPIHVAPTSRPGSGDAPTGVLRGTRFGCVPPVTPEHRWERGDRISDSAAIQDAWYVLARAGTDGASRTPAAAQDAVFRRYLPMARTLANGPGNGAGRVIRPTPNRPPNSFWRRPCWAGGGRTAVGSRCSPAPPSHRSCDVGRPGIPATSHPVGGPPPATHSHRTRATRRRSFPPRSPGAAMRRARGWYSFTGRQR